MLIIEKDVVDRHLSTTLVLNVVVLVFFFFANMRLPFIYWFLTM